MIKQVGSIGVDAGLCWIGDPCYILHTKRPKSIGKDWGAFCDIVSNKRAHEFDYDLGRPGLGVCVSTGYGDGFYPVFANVNKDGRIMAVSVNFSSSKKVFDMLMKK